MSERIPCRCLLHESYPDMETLIQSVVSSMSEDERTPEALYRARLDVCLACPHLIDGTCVLCGCYVEARAASRFSACPDVPARWSSLSSE
ncbi:MAG: hypothetical protein IJI38_01970 [Clostridia bacterium]|nr:hypothetical protein [Clostridia bacterium]